MKISIVPQLCLCLSILSLCSCVSSGVRQRPPTPQESRLDLTFDNCKFTFNGEFTNTDADNNAVSTFLAAMETMASVRQGAPSTNGYIISSVVVDSSVRTSRGSDVAKSILSTPILPLSFVRSRCSATVRVSYVITSPDGKHKMLREAQRRYTGSYSGWSFIRFAFRGQARTRVASQIPYVAAQLLSDDIRKIHATNSIGPTLGIQDTENRGELTLVKHSPSSL